MMALAQTGDPPARGRLRAARLQRRLQPGPDRRRRGRAPHPHARRAALVRRQQLHAGDRRHQSDAADDRAELRGAEGSVLSEQHLWPRRDLQGLRHPRPLRRGDGRGTAHAIGRAFVRVLARLRDKQPAELRVGLGRDMRLTAPTMAAELRDGLIFEGATVLDAGHGRDRDALPPGRLARARRRRDGHRLAQPEGLHRRQAGPRGGAAALRRRRDRRSAGARSRRGWAHAPGGGSLEEVDIWDEYRAHALSFIDPGAVKPMKVVVDGGNGMGGPMVGPILEKLPLELEEMYFVPNGEFPDHEPNPLLEENRRMIIERVRSSGADLGIAWDGDADRCFFIDGSGEFCDGDFICALLARSVAGQEPGRDDPLRPALEPRRPRPGRRRGRPLRPLAGRPCLLQGADARGGRGLRRRGLRPLLLPRLLERRLGDDPGAADAGAALQGRPHASAS